MKMVEVLRSRPGITIYELTQAVQRSQRTVYRWLGELADDLNTVVYCQGGGYYLGDDTGGRGIGLSAQELLALRLSLKSGPFGKGSPLQEHAESAWLKIRNASSTEAIEAVRDIIAKHSVRVKSHFANNNQQLISTLERAVNRRCRLRVVYRSQKSNSVKEYIIDPYAVVFRKHSWYLLARSQEHGKVVQFKLVRFQSAEETGARFDRPDDFSVQDYFNWSWEAWGGDEPVTVRIKFSPRVARMIAESKRHQTQQNIPQPDGGLIMEARVSSITEIATWVMGYGKDAQVLDPPELRRWLSTTSRAWSSLYKSVEVKSSDISAAIKS